MWWQVVCVRAGRTVGVTVVVCGGGGGRCGEGEPKTREAGNCGGGG